MNELAVIPCLKTWNRLNVVYSGFGPTASAQEVLNTQVKCFWEDLERLTSIRHELAVSGAMRWPWSQEAAMSYDRGVTFK